MFIDTELVEEIMAQPSSRIVYIWKKKDQTDPYSSMNWYKCFIRNILLEMSNL